MPRALCVGCRVQGAHGPLMQVVENRAPAVAENVAESSAKRPRRKRRNISGTVIGHAGEKWIVRWDDDVVATTDYRASTLKLVSEQATPPLTKDQREHYMAEYRRSHDRPQITNPTGGASAAAAALPGTTQPSVQQQPATRTTTPTNESLAQSFARQYNLPLPTATSTTTDVPTPPDGNIAADPPDGNIAADLPDGNIAADPPVGNIAADPPNGNIEADTTETDGHVQDPDLVEEEDFAPMDGVSLERRVASNESVPEGEEVIHDPRAVEGLVQSSPGERATYEAEKNNLIGEQVVKETGRRQIVWTVRNDVTAEEVGTAAYLEHPNIGVVDFVADPSSFDGEQRELAVLNAEQSFLQGSPSQRTRSSHERYNHMVERNGRSQQEQEIERNFRQGSPSARTRSSHQHNRDARFRRTLRGGGEESSRNQNSRGERSDAGGEPSSRKITERANLYPLLVKLWAGNWRRHMLNINKEVDIYNDDVEKKVDEGFYNTRNRPALIKHVSAKEFWTFWGLMLFSAVVDGKGNIWETAEEHEGLQSPQLNMSRYMQKHRFEKIRRFVPNMAASWDRKETDPWWQVVQMVEDFNANRTQRVRASKTKTDDERMMGVRPRTTKYGDPALPHISHILRKPVPLGIELKNVADTATGIMIHIEIQRGKEPMKRQQYSLSHGATTACTLRMAESCKKCGQEDKNRDGSETPSDIVLGDSWFASVNTAEQLALKCNSRFVGVVKTAHGRYPKLFLEQKMKNWPAGSHLVLEGTTLTGVRLLAIGYKYNKRKVLCFIATATAGHTEQGEPYKAKWIGDNGEKFMKTVPRPDVIARYFRFSNGIDKHNHARQGILALEEQWVTRNGFFRFQTSIFGITVTDCWKAYRYHLQPTHDHKNLTILKFADMLCYDLLNRTPFGEVSAHNLPQRFVPPRQIGQNGEDDEADDDMSPLSGQTGSLSRQSSVRKESLLNGYQVTRDHALVETNEHERDGTTTRKKRRHCEICSNSRPRKKTKTAKLCRSCRTPICGRECLILHQNEILKEREVSLFA
jgi:hypothetical protein